MCRVAMISVHGCPLAPLGLGETGGMQVYIRQLAAELGKRGFVVDVYTRLTDPALPEIVPIAENARVIHLKAGDVSRMDKNVVLDHLPEFVCNILRFSQEHCLDYQFVHSHYWLSGWVGRRISKRWSCPHVVTFHTLGKVKNQAKAGPAESERRVAIEARVAAEADAIVASSEHDRQALIGLYQVRGDRIRVIPPGVDFDQFRPLSQAYARTQLGLNGRDILVSVGRMDPVKGLDLLIEAAALLQNNERLQVLIIGGQEGEPAILQLQDLAQRLGIADRVQFLGAMPQDQLPLYYAAADICVVPSHSESFGLVAAEALACGTPVIASKVGGLSSIIEDGRNGVLVPWRCARAFAERIEWLLGDRDTRDRLSAAARPSVERFSWAVLGERVSEIYHELREPSESGQVCLCQ